MRTTRLTKLAVLGVAAALVLAACGSDDSDSPSTDAPAETDATTDESTEAPAETEAAGTEAPADSAADGGEAAAVDLSGVCPETIIIQTDWFPEAEHGALYEMVGENPTIDAERKVVSGPLVAQGGAETGVNIEIRTGGPAIGFQQVVSIMQQDQDILLGYVATDEAIENYAEIPTKAIVAPLEINPQIIMWDPETYPDVETIADLQEQDVTIRYFQTGAYMNYLVSSGQVAEGQLDGSYDGSPAVFVAEGGAIAQQGFASAEPYTYENLIAEWMKPVQFQLIHDAGWETYAAPLAVLDSKLEENRECFAALVPIVQQAQVDYINDPTATNELIVEAVVAYADFWVYSADLAEFSVQQQLDLGLVGNGPNDTLGDFDNARLEGFIPIATEVFAAKNPGDLTPDDLVTNEFIDTSIGL
jgi:hypothetical protein